VTIVSDACTINVSVAIAIALANIVNYGRKRCHSIEHHLLMTLESSFKIQICLYYWYNWFVLSSYTMLSIVNYGSKKFQIIEVLLHV
jgi:hypothetical protein